MESDLKSVTRPPQSPLETKRLRVSYTLLSLWRMGRVDEAVSFYLKKPIFQSDAMKQGIKWDKTVQASVEKSGKLPIEFGGELLKNAKCQVKLERQFSEIADIVGVIDVLTDDTLLEIKTGNSKDSADYSTDFQVSMYFLLCPEKVKKAYIIHFNQYTGEMDKTLIYNTPYERERGRNFVETLSPEVHEYFSKIGLLDKQS